MAGDKEQRSVTVRRLAPDAKGLDTAAEMLRAGGLVAFPTETVYGLGADASDGRAVARIFEAKGRPAFNPLIVHVPDLAMAQRIGVLPAAAEALVNPVWPLSLTVVVPLQEGADISPLVTAGNSTVALRVPGHPLALKLLTAVERPIAAPSANPSGRISATTADHVLSGLGDRIDAVLDGGPTQVGLESTILGFDTGAPVVLREGGYLVAGARRDTRCEPGEAPVVAPGQLSSHYAPRARVRLDVLEAEPGEFHLGFGPVQGDLSLSAKGDLTEAAANLFSHLHRADAMGVDALAVAPVPDKGLGRAINDRLRRAAAPR